MAVRRRIVVCCCKRWVPAGTAHGQSTPGGSWRQLTFAVAWQGSHHDTLASVDRLDSGCRTYRALRSQQTRAKSLGT